MVMMDYILEQTELFRKVLSCREEEAAAFCDMTAQNNPAQICLIASGTSYNAACAAAPFMEMILGKPVSVNVPSQVEKLKEYRLDVPQVTEVAYELKKEGIPLTDGILTIDELVNELCQLKLKI